MRRGRSSRVALIAVAAVTMAFSSLTLGEVPAGATAAPHAATPSPITANFWLVTPSGAVESYGVPSYGALSGPLNRPIVSTLVDHSQSGYWLVASDGGVFAYGDTHFYGSTGNINLNQPIVSMAQTPDDKGYWMVARDGGIFAFGDAAFYGSTGAIHLNQPIVGMASTSDGKGYWMVAADGGVFSFGDAAFYGSTGNITLRQPIVSLARTTGDTGYWMVAADGGVFSFGDAAFYGSTGNITLRQPIVSLARTTGDTGYWMVAADGGVFSFGDAKFLGSSAGTASEPVSRLVANDTSDGYWVVQQNGTMQAFGAAVGQAPPPQALMFEPITPGDKAVLFAFQQVGKPYIWGGNGPVGYDCSGLTLNSWQHGAGVGFARVANDQYHTAGNPVALNQMAAGDLVFWGSNTADWTTVYHAGIYVGGNRIVESTGDHDFDAADRGEIVTTVARLRPDESGATTTPKAGRSSSSGNMTAMRWRAPVVRWRAVRDAPHSGSSRAARSAGR
jgi:cell wall-associated NlpC family hydrolase